MGARIFQVSTIGWLVSLAQEDSWVERISCTETSSSQRDDEFATRRQEELHPAGLRVSTSPCAECLCGFMGGNSAQLLTQPNLLPSADRT